ncbi:single-stranded DNA-binding protein [Chitinophaga arvensicola]|uniref:Single-strand binding protein family protein n=1 Tax=Chitinophaga arvensicola TaxID=29529 RepID=A0A1I0PPP8_9BACT|nr:single-stranded DNA-binding protein [Chitinophaga arvensicola]SEW16359.1 Single-strand binding protein family protein [Chitinophaga arvensicola]
MCTVTGTVTRNANVGETKTGLKIVNFTVAVEYPYYDKKEEKKKKRTAYWNCHYYRAEKVAEHILMGQVLEVVGFPYPDSFVKGNDELNSQLHLIVDTIKFHGAKPGKSKPVKKEQAGEQNVNEDQFADLPF